MTRIPRQLILTALVLVAMVAALAPVSPASAQAADPDGYEEVLTFDTYDTGALAGQDSWQTSGSVTVADDPDGGDNQVMQLSGSLTLARRAVEGIANNTTGTVFFRMFRDDTVDANAGLSAAAQPSVFGDYEVQANTQESEVLNARNGGVFAFAGTFAQDVWQCVWMVADNTNDTYRMYSRGGPYDQVTLLPVGQDVAYNFRNGTSGSLGQFFTQLGNQSGGGDMFLDDIAVDTDGENLAVPGGDAQDKCGEGEIDPDQPLLNPLPDPEPSNLGLVLEEFVTLPASAPTSGNVTDTRLRRHNRINHLDELPDDSGRMAVPDLNGPLYMVADDGSWVEYMNLTDEFPDMHNHAGLGTGFGFVAFHPEFATNGTFYTVHTESGAALSKASDFPTFGSTVTQGTITEWIADDPDAATFSGTSTEMMRISFGGRIHGIQQIGFNPTVDAGDDDYGMLYMLVGDGGNGVDNDNPQDLTTPHGKIFRIDPMGSDGRTGEYGIPDDNPFLDTAGALPEIYAVGMRDPHRMSWDPAAGNRMFLGHIGEWQVESVYDVRAGDNFGWSEREGPFLAANRQLYPLPANDAQNGYTYPVAAYDHDRDPGQTGDAGIALAGGFVYRGSIDLLEGHYVFTDLVRGYPYATRAGQMQRGGDLAPIEHLKLWVDGEETTFAQLNADNDPTDGSDDRIDLRIGRDAEGELYMVSKGSGTIWRVVDAVATPPHDTPGVLPSLAQNMVAHYDFDHPWDEDATFESDRGLSGTPIELVNGGTDMRVDDSPYPGAGNSMQVQAVSGGANDWKAGVYDANGVESLGAFNEADAISLMGWFKQTGTNPSPGYNAIGLAGVLTGTSEGHLVRALLEVFVVNGEMRLVALGRRLDGGGSWVFAADAPWADLLPPDEWVHLAATFDFDGGSMQLFANGEPLDGFYTSGGNPWGRVGDGPFYTSPTDPTGIKIGGSYPQNTQDTNPCNCRMDDLMFLDRAVTADEVATQYAAMVDDGGDTGDQVITATVPEDLPGEFVWEIQGDAQVDLGDMTDEGSYLQATGAIDPISVMDTRDGGLVWSISGQSSDFEPNGPVANHLGWTPMVIEEGAGATAGPAVPSGIDGGDGLSASSTLASASAGHDEGTAVVGADIDLRFPADTDPGDYAATLTITALS